MTNEHTKKILVLDDDKSICASLCVLLKYNGFQTYSEINPAVAIEAIEKFNPEVVILDMNFSNKTSGEDGLMLLDQIKKLNPSTNVILITGWATVDLAVQGMKKGASDFISKPWKNDHLIQTIRAVLSLKKEENFNIDRKILNDKYDFKQIIGQDPKVLEILELIGRVASTDASVLITGESGTGKELFAESIHQNSLRSKNRFVKVNLGGISTSIFESEMFGHVRGSFTGAHYNRTGRFELADNGTIFLDEIGDLDQVNQVKLLRVLQDRTYEVLGSSRSKQLNTRVICATNKNLENMVAEGTFREDLLYRINLISVELPSLRERPNDIPLLVNFFLQNLSNLYQRTFQISVEAMNWLKQLSLPGNIRQLKNLVESTILISGKDKLELADFKSRYEPHKIKAKDHFPEVGTMTLEEMEVAMINRAMKYHKDKISQVAQSLGLTRSSLYRRFEKYNIPYQDQ